MEIAQERKPDCEFVEAKQMDHQRRLIDVEELARAEVLAWAVRLQVARVSKKKPRIEREEGRLCNLEGALARLKLCHTVTD